MTENESHSPEEILDEILAGLQTEDSQVIRDAIARLDLLTYSSDSIRRKLEGLAISHPNADIRQGAADSLKLKTNRFVRSRVNKLSFGDRHIILKELMDWEKSDLLSKSVADVIRRRYDFDIEPAAEVAPRLVEAPASSAESEAASIQEP